MSTQKTETQNIQVEQLPEQATNNNAKKQNSLENGLAVAALFFTLGIVMHFFGTATNTMALDGLYQFLAGGSFIIGFMGALIELSNYSKKDYTSLALGIVFGAIAYGIHLLVAIVEQKSQLSAVLLEIVFAGAVCLATYGITRGMINIVSHSGGSVIDMQDPKPLSKGEKRERVIGYIIAFLSLLFGLIQTLPIIIEFVKGFLPH